MSDPGKLTAIVVAGDRGKSHPVFGKNKAFLEVQGVPVITRVVSALDRSRSVSEIYVVGPKERLEETLRAAHGGIEIVKPVHIFEQRANLYDNMWTTFLETIPAYRSGEPEETIARGPDSEKAILGLAADMPLLTSAEIDEFVSNCDMDRYDYVIGVTSEENLEHFYPREGMHGIRMAYLHFRGKNLRQNNLAMVRPFKIINRHYIQIMYDLRYQKESGNMARLAWEILRKEEGGWGTVGYYLLMQLSLTFDRLRLGFMRDLIRKRTPVEAVVDCIARLMKTRFTIAHTSFGGAALDIDHEEEYEAIQQRFSDWMSYQEEKSAKLQSSASPRR